MVHTREAQTRELTLEEWLSAGGKYLTPQAFQRVGRRLSVTMDDFASFRTTVPMERERRGVTQDISSVEDWARLLPDTYAEARSIGETATKIAFERALTPSLRGDQIDPTQVARADDPEYKRWLANMRVGPETTFTMVARDRSTALSSLEAAYPTSLTSLIGRALLDFRPLPDGVAAILPLNTSSFRGKA